MLSANSTEGIVAHTYFSNVSRICLKNSKFIILIIFRILFRIIPKNIFYPGPSDCDSEGGDGWSDDEDSDSETRGTGKPGAMGLKFQLDAARAGELLSILMDPRLTKLHSLALHQ